jgi:ligand-binding sensor domain-containing protein/signal transduction histidine kinase
VIVALTGIAPVATALDPHTSLDQYSRRAWPSELLRRSVRAIAQTTDGYLWLASDEGLIRFDGYEFSNLTKSDGSLPEDAISALCAARDGSLWIGTRNGLSHYVNKQFRTYTTKDGLPDNFINRIFEDHTGALWIAAGAYLTRLNAGTFKTFKPNVEIPITVVNDVSEDQHGQLWVGGRGGIAKLMGEKFVSAMILPDVSDKTPTAILADRHNNLWAASASGLIEMSPSGKVRSYRESHGLPATSVYALLEDRGGNIWLGTGKGLARLERNRIVTSHNDSPVRSVFEDHDANLWVASPDGLNLLRDNAFTTYYQARLPSDEPNTVVQDRSGRVWIGFHSSGLALISKESQRTFTTQDGLPSNEILSIRENRAGDLLIGTRSGLVHMRGTHLNNFMPDDFLNRKAVFDTLESSAGKLWVAVNGGLIEFDAGKRRDLIPLDPSTLNPVVNLYQDRDGVLWAGTDGKGLWRIQGDSKRLFTTAEGLSSNWIRSIYQDPDGTLWIGTFGGGLNSLRNGRFLRFTTKEGLPSNNVMKVIDSGETLLLNTTSGIYQIPKRQLRDFSEGKRQLLEPINYALSEGLSSARCTPNDFPYGGGGGTEGRLWFTTSCGLAVLSPDKVKRFLPPAAHVEEMIADGRSVDLTHAARLKLKTGRIEIRYAGIHLGAPQRVQYSYRLEGLDRDWVQAGSRRVADYNSLRPGRYRFILRAGLSDGTPDETSYSFQLLPSFYATTWFRFLCVIVVLTVALAMYRLHVWQIQNRFELVLEERAGLARELHDTVVQNLFGIASQLEAVLQGEPDEQRHLETALRMTRYSLTEARRSLTDLRLSRLDGQDLTTALQSGIRSWTAESEVRVDFDVDSGSSSVTLPGQTKQELLRIAQEAVCNALKHAGANKIRVKLHVEGRRLSLRIADDGRGFEQREVLSTQEEEHFGLIGMHERAERLGGDLRLVSHCGQGTEVEVTVPLV